MFTLKLAKTFTIKSNLFKVGSSSIPSASPTSTKTTKLLHVFYTQYGWNSGHMDWMNGVAE